MTDNLKVNSLDQIPNAQRFAWLALAVFLLAEIISIFVFRYTDSKTYFAFVALISVKTLIVCWALPVLVACRVEKRALHSLGLSIPPERYLRYAALGLLALFAPLLIIGYDPYYPIEFLEQVLYIGFPEEVFYRGYLMTRLCQWLGKYRGLIAASLLFGLGHVISRLADHGLGYLSPAISTGLQAFFGGLIFGIIYLKAKNIWPSAILHVSSNMYWGDLIALS